MHRPYPHCPRCGAALPETAWPRRCGGCDRLAYLTPAPVGVVLQPVEGAGLVIIQRDIPPHRGAWALPGGFLDQHEAWRAGCARELREETGIVVEPSALELLDLLDAVEDNLLLLIALAPPLAPDALPPFRPNSECAARALLAAPRALAFPLHTRAAEAYFARM